MIFLIYVLRRSSRRYARDRKQFRFSSRSTRRIAYNSREQHHKLTRCILSTTIRCSSCSCSSSIQEYFDSYWGSWEYHTCENACLFELESHARRRPAHNRNRSRYARNEVFFSCRKLRIHTRNPILNLLEEVSSFVNRTFTLSPQYLSSFIFYSQFLW